MDIEKACENVQQIYNNRACGIRVLVGTHPKFGEVAIKIIECGSENSLRFYEREGRIAVSVTHPSICKVFEKGSGMVGNIHRHYIVMEKAHSDLYKEIKKRTQLNTPWTEQSLINMLEQAVGALLHAQRNQVCHRDIKPQNILMGRNGRLKLADFGSANEGIARSVVQTLTLQGTPLYLSPELRKYYSLPESQRQGRPRYNPYKSDVYSLGLTFLHMICLHPPTELSRLEGLNTATYDKIQALRVSHVLREILTSMLEVQEESRPDFQQLEEVVMSLVYGSISRQPKVRPMLENYTRDASDPNTPPPEEEEEEEKEDVFSQTSEVLSPPDSAAPSVIGSSAPRHGLFHVVTDAVQGGVHGEGMQHKKKEDHFVIELPEEKPPTIEERRNNVGAGCVREQELKATIITKGESFGSPKAMQGPPKIEIPIQPLPSQHTLIKSSHAAHPPADPKPQSSHPRCGQPVANLPLQQAPPKLAARPLLTPGADTDYDKEPEQGQCANCFIEIDDTAIELSCPHRICSAECLKVLLEQMTKCFRAGFEEVTCPVASCRRPISVDVLRTECCDGQTIRSYKSRQPQVCLECRRPTDMRPLVCTHRFCQRCLNGWHKLAQRRKMMTIVCSVCHEELDDEDLNLIASLVNIPL